MSKPPAIVMALYGMPDLYLQKVNTVNIPDKANRIIDFICLNKGVGRLDVMSQSRKGHINYTRQLIIFVLRNRTPLSLQAIGATISRHHSVILHNLEAVQNYLDTDPEKAAEIKRFLEVIY